MTLLHGWGRCGLLPRRGKQDGSHWHAGWSWGSSPERGLGGPSPAASFQLSGPLAPHPGPNAGLPGGPWGDAGFFLLPTPPSTCGCADLGEAVIQAQSGCWGRAPSSGADAGGDPPSSGAGRQIYRHTFPHATTAHRLAPPAPRGSTLAASVTPCPLLGPCHLSLLPWGSHATFSFQW